MINFVICSIDIWLSESIRTVFDGGVVHQGYIQITQVLYVIILLVFFFWLLLECHSVPNRFFIRENISRQPLERLWKRKYLRTPLCVYLPTPDLLVNGGSQVVSGLAPIPIRKGISIQRWETSSSLTVRNGFSLYRTKYNTYAGFWWVSSLALRSSDKARSRDIGITKITAGVTRANSVSAWLPHHQASQQQKHHTLGRPADIPIYSLYLNRVVTRICRRPID